MSENSGTACNDDRQSALRDAIRRVFPDVVYRGQVTRHDGAWLPELTEENEIHQDDRFLYEELYGHKWSDIPRDFLYGMAADFVLLTPEALAVFLPAWLICSLENPSGENTVREHLVYAFMPSDRPGKTEFSINMLRALNVEQRVVLRVLLAESAKRDRSSLVREYAQAAVRLIDSLGQ